MIEVFFGLIVEGEVFNALATADLTLPELTTALSLVVTTSGTYADLLFTGSLDILLRIEEAVTIVTAELLPEVTLDAMEIQAQILIGEC